MREFTANITAACRIIKFTVFFNELLIFSGVEF